MRKTDFEELMHIKILFSLFLFLLCSSQAAGEEGAKTGVAVAPSNAGVIYECRGYLSFPAIARTGNRLSVIFRKGQGNALDFNSKVYITHSTDRGKTWTEPNLFIARPGVDTRNCGGGMLPDGRAHFVMDMHGGKGAWRRTFYVISDDGETWSKPVRLHAEIPGKGKNQITSICNRAIRWDNDATLYFPHFMKCGRSVLLHPDGSQTQTHSIPRIEPALAWNRRGELVAFSNGGAVDVSIDKGATWQAIWQLSNISQPDLISLKDGRLVFCYSGKYRSCEYLLLSEDAHDLQDAKPLKIFEGDDGGKITRRGKAQCIEYGNEILTVLYESLLTDGRGKIILVRTPKTQLP